MKITDIQTIQLTYPYTSYIADGCSPCFGRGALLVQVETDEGISGLGECATFGASMSAMADVVERQLKRLLLGKNPLDIEYLWETMVWSNFANGRRGIVMGAISGIDIALWDILGKAANLPLYRLLGANRDRVRGYASGGFYGPEKSVDDLKREMEGYVKRGYSAFKMKIGRRLNSTQTPHRYVRKGDFLYSFEQDMERVRAVRETIGDEGILMLDMNGTWEKDEILAAEPYFDEYKIYWIEEPIRSDDVDGCREIASALKHTRVAGCEEERGADAIQRARGKGRTGCGTGQPGVERRLHGVQAHRGPRPGPSSPVHPSHVFLRSSDGGQCPLCRLPAERALHRIGGKCQSSAHRAFEGTPPVRRGDELLGSPEARFGH